MTPCLSTIARLSIAILAAMCAASPARADAARDLLVIFEHTCAAPSHPESVEAMGPLAVRFGLAALPSKPDPDFAVFQIWKRDDGAGGVLALNLYFRDRGAGPLGLKCVLGSNYEKRDVDVQTLVDELVIDLGLPEPDKDHAGVADTQAIREWRWTVPTGPNDRSYQVLYSPDGSLLIQFARNVAKPASP